MINIHTMYKICVGVRVCVRMCLLYDCTCEHKLLQSKVNDM